MSGKVPLILGCARLAPSVSRAPISFRPVDEKFYVLVGSDYPKRVFRVDIGDGVELTPFLNDSVLLDEIHKLKRELLGSPRRPEEPIAINWGQSLAGIFPRENYILAYTPLTGLMKFQKSYHSVDDNIAAIVGCNQRRCTAVVWDPLTSESSEYYIELNELRDVSCRRGVCVANASEESVILRPRNNPIYLPLSPTQPLTVCEGNTYLMYKSDEGSFVIKVTGTDIDPLIPIEGMPTATCLGDSLVLCTSEIGCGILRERLWMGLTNHFFIPFSAADIATLNPVDDTEVILVNSSGVITSIKSKVCVPNDEGLLLCMSDGYIVASSIHTMVEPSIEVLKSAVDVETYATVRVRVPGKCSEVEVVGNVSGHRLEHEGVVHLHLRPVRLGDTASPVIVIRSPLAELARRIIITSSAPRLESIVVEKADASVVGRLTDDPEMNALIVGHAALIKTSPGTWSAHILVPPGFVTRYVHSEDRLIKFLIVGKSRPGAVVPISLELVDEIGSKYVIPGSVVTLREAKIDRVVRSSTIKVSRYGIEAPGKVRVLCADGKVIEPDSEEDCPLPSLIEAVLVEDSFEAEIGKVIGCTDPGVPKNFRCTEISGEVEGIAIRGDGVLHITGSVGLTALCGESVEAGRDIDIALKPLDLVDGCRIYLAPGRLQPIIIRREELIRGAILAALLSAKKLLDATGMAHG